MITDNGKYYLYRWVRCDKNEPFYIGIGTKTITDINYYTYARSKGEKKNNDIWKRIKNKSTYEIEILIESDDYKFIKEKEIEFIKLYGRIDTGTGTLANMTDGGDGTVGVIVSESAKQKRREYRTGKKMSKESIQKRTDTLKANGRAMLPDRRRNISTGRGSSIMQFSLEGVYIRTYPSIGIAVETIKCKGYEIRGCLHSKRNNSGAGFFWIYEKMYREYKIEKLVKAIDKYLQTGRRSSNITLHEKINIIEEYNNTPGKSLREKCKAIANKRKMKYRIIEYYIKNQDKLISKLKNYEYKMKLFIDYLQDSATEAGYPPEKVVERTKEVKLKYNL